MSRTCLAACALSVFLAVLVVAADPAAPPAPDQGILPLGADGKPLNLDFETGTLKDWTAEGEAFKAQPIKGDTVVKRRGDMKSQHQGNYWIGTYEVAGDKPQGTLTSAGFKVTHPWASFLVGGGPHKTTCVELVRKDTGAVFHRSSGMEEENMRRVVVDLKEVAGKEIFIRLVDRHSGHWGHINFDDFRFHTNKPKFPERPKPLEPDTYKYAGLPPKKAAEAMTVPEGFLVKLFAGEPDVRQPIALCLDDRGRVWVAEAYCYPTRRKDGEANDRIVIFEDTTGKGTFDKRTVFMEGLNLVSGLEVGFGGVWIGAAPYLMFVPVKPGEDKPAGKPQILLDGWGYQDTHETLNTFSWGPDGWLYGCHGVFTHSRVGKPGTPDEKRVPINAGVWRYHPTRHVFEVFAQGTSNPWGLDFNDYGQAFCEACVIPHAFHIIQGGRYTRQAGNHFNPHTYEDIKTIADHFHYVGGNPHGGNNRSDSAGGGHAHCGTMIYLGGAWPAEYRGQMFMGNIHGRRLNVDALKPKGSGYVASHTPDFLLANDAWARFINMRYGPDGNVFLIDWYDQQACHTGDVKIWDRSNGRIYKVCYRGTKPVQVDLAKKTDKELVELQLNANDWYVRHARRLLQERYAKQQQPNATHIALADIAFRHKDETRQLRALWALHVIGGLRDPGYVASGLGSDSAWVRAWTIQLALEAGKADDTFLKKLAALAEKDPSPVVRLYLASGLQQVPNEQRWAILEGLLAHGEDAADHNLPLMYWYAAEPLAAVDAARALELAARSKVPQILPFMVRRIGSTGSPDALKLLVAALAKADDPAVQRTFLRGLGDALKGRRQVPMPDGWAAVFVQLKQSKDGEVHDRALALAATFGDGRALDEMRKVLAAPNADLGARQSALASLLGANDRQLAPVLHKLLGERALRGAALRTLAAYDDPKTPGLIVEVYASLTTEEKRDAVNTLAARASYGKALLTAVAAKKIPQGKVSADVIRQLRNLQDKELDKQIADVWGIVRQTPADRVRLIAQYKKMLRTAPPAKPDLAHGRAMFARTCAQCHTLFGVGGKVGPELTGSNRANLDYLLENILDPSAVIPKEYAASVIGLKDGRVVTGIVRSQTDAALTVVTANETLTVPKQDIDFRKESDVSMMPDDLLKPLSEVEVRALVAYLQNPKPAALLATAENAKDFFNGKDLSGWDGDTKLWKVEGGELIGRSPGLKEAAVLRSHMIAGDFRLTMKVKLVPDAGNAAVMVRGEALPDAGVKGPRAGIGAGAWGKLSSEGVTGKPADPAPAVKAGEWNDYEIVAMGGRIRTSINGKACAELDDPATLKRGLFVLVLPAGGAVEVRLKDVRLNVGGGTPPK